MCTNLKSAVMESELKYLIRKEDKIKRSLTKNAEDLRKKEEKSDNFFFTKDITQESSIIV